MKQYEINGKTNRINLYADRVHITNNYYIGSGRSRNIGINKSITNNNKYQQRMKTSQEMLDLDMNMNLLKLKVDKMNRMLSHIASSKSPNRSNHLKTDDSHIDNVKESTCTAKLTTQADIPEVSYNGMEAISHRSNTKKNLYSDFKSKDFPNRYNLDYIFVQESDRKSDKKYHIKNVSSRYIFVI